jgi:hypothetical protein
VHTYNKLEKGEGGIRILDIVLGEKY